MKSVREGIFICLVGPAGSGKSSLGEELRKRFPDLGRSLSVTTRAPRAGEEDGVHYQFVSAADFQGKVDRREFFEHEETHGNRYGTLKANLEAAQRMGRDLFFDVDIRGALNLKRAFPLHTVIVFLAAPSSDELVARMKKRGSVSDQELATRLDTARREYESLVKVSRDPGAIDYFIVNDKFDVTLETLSSVFAAERTRLHRLQQNFVDGICSIGGTR